MNEGTEAPLPWQELRQMMVDVALHSFNSRPISGTLSRTKCKHLRFSLGLTVTSPILKATGPCLFSLCGKLQLLPVIHRSTMPTASFALRTKGLFIPCLFYELFGRSSESIPLLSCMRLHPIYVSGNVWPNHEPDISVVVKCLFFGKYFSVLIFLLAPHSTMMLLCWVVRCNCRTRALSWRIYLS